MRNRENTARRAAEIWHYDTLQAESESAAMWHINLKKKKEKEEEKGANEKINTKAALQRLAKEANICSVLLWRESWNIMEIIHPLQKKREAAWLQCVMWKLCLVTAARSVHII